MMRVIFIVLLLIALPPASLLGQQRQSVFAITHVTVIDATGAPPQFDMTVVISGGRIAKLGKTARTALPKSAQVINAAGNFLIPGLWDMHVHFWNEEKLLQLYIANGVTGVRDMGGRLERVKRWRQSMADRKL